MSQLTVSIGQYSDKGLKKLNQDFHGAYVPMEPQLSSKGIAVALADGISSSDVSQIASETAITSFLNDYYCTSDAWSVKKSAQRVLQATNSWLFAQTHNSPFRFNKEKGYICTFSGLILKSTTAHLFHSGDSRIYRLNEQGLELLTQDHRYMVDESNSYLTRAMGIHHSSDFDYRALPIEQGELFVLATDGVYEFLNADDFKACLEQHSTDLDTAAKQLVEKALENGSDDNLTLQLVRIERLPQYQLGEVSRKASSLPMPPKLRPRMAFDGYQILREIHLSSRSHVFLAQDKITQQRVVLKTPSMEMRCDPVYLESLLMEEWVASRLDNAHLLKAIPHSRKRNYLYLVTEFVEGQSLLQWMRDNPTPSVEQVRSIISQVAKGLQAMHRNEMIHQDLRPHNIMIDTHGVAKIIDFGSTQVAGVVETGQADRGIQGTRLYSAPEYFIGEGGSARSDIFALGVIAYQLLSGRTPYGNQVSQAHTKALQRRLSYHSVLDEEKAIPAWVDDALKKAVHIDPLKRYSEASEFVADLYQPNQAFLNKTKPPLMERDPVLFWQLLCVALVAALIIQGAYF